MLIKADLKCYYCGHVAGQIQGDTSTPAKSATFVAAAGEMPIRRGGQIRCGRCKGPLYMDDIETIRPRRMRPRVEEPEFIQARAG